MTKKTMQFADDRPVLYRDVTRATDGSSFELQITAAREVNAFGGKTLAVECEGDSMRMTGYLSHDDFMRERNPQQIVTWERDEEDAEEDSPGEGPSAQNRNAQAKTPAVGSAER
ncbi:MAG TPA: hypothetical protein VF551_04705, partial [Chthoniobacterales bacterium]